MVDPLEEGKLFHSTSERLVSLGKQPRIFNGGCGLIGKGVQQVEVVLLKDAIVQPIVYIHRAQDAVAHLEWGTHDGTKLIANDAVLPGKAVVFLSIAMPGLLATAEPLPVSAPHRNVPLVNQLALSGNACGPAALLNAFNLASPRWREIPQAIPVENDRGRISYIIRRHGARPSRHLAGRPRWESGTGISLVDLTDVANEMRGTRRLPELEWEVLLPRKRESANSLMDRAHGRLAKSLRRGFPPVIGLQRMARRKVGSEESWVTVYGHFIVVTSLPRSIPRKADRIPFEYADSWGGKLRTGTLRLETGHGFAAVVAELPESRVGSRLIRRGEQSIVIASSSLGDF